MEQNIEYASLYEYLGRRAGMDLGQQVFQEAKKQRIRCATKQVNQGGYEGKVMTYPITFLKVYFGSTNPTTNNSSLYPTY